jgi:hypothetical protein
VSLGARPAGNVVTADLHTMFANHIVAAVRATLVGA